MKHIYLSFTLVELLVVIAIIGVLASIVLISVTRLKAKSVDTAAFRNLAETQKIVNVYGIHDGDPQITDNMSDMEEEEEDICYGGEPETTGKYPDFDERAKGTSGIVWSFIE